MVGGGGRARTCEDALRRLRSHADILETRMVILETRMMILQSKMTCINSRLNKLSMQSRRERLLLQVETRPFEEVAPKLRDPFVQRVDGVDIMARESGRDRWGAVARQQVIGSAPAMVPMPADVRSMARALG